MPALITQPPISSPFTIYMSSFLSCHYNVLPFMRIIEIIGDFGGTYFAPQPKQLKDPFFKLMLSNSHLGVMNQRAVFPLPWSIIIL